MDPGGSVVMLSSFDGASCIHFHTTCSVERQFLYVLAPFFLSRPPFYVSAPLSRKSGSISADNPPGVEQKLSESVSALNDCLDEQGLANRRYQG